ncbi:uncharacterized protein [Miscanthus floridulus]|uniref:uncharacterized protein n=1 Tax=Miscanthus floridulus TaxID=154761 RepID=UPI0034580DA7
MSWERLPPRPGLYKGADPVAALPAASPTPLSNSPVHAEAATAAPRSTVRPSARSVVAEPPPSSFSSTMSHNPKTARLSTAGYHAMFTPSAPQVEKEIVVISDDEEWMATPTPTPAPAPTPAVAPVYAVVATPTESLATSPMPVPPLVVPVVDEEMG